MTVSRMQSESAEIVSLLYTISLTLKALLGLGMTWFVIWLVWFVKRVAEGG